ncbi:MAG: nucleotidyltransferase domain-containing protein [Alloacidobacterium sp.]
MRLTRGDRIAGVDGLQLRRYFRRFGNEQVNYATVMDKLSVTRRQAEKLLTELLKLEMISRCEFQHDKKMVSYQTTIRGNALGMAKAGKPVTRASAEEVLRKFLDRVRVVNGRQELAHSVESVVVFGSYLSDAKRLNDLDIAVELRAKWHDDASFQNYRNASLDRARARAAIPELGGRGLLAAARSDLDSKEQIAKDQLLRMEFVAPDGRVALLRGVWRQAPSRRFAQKRTLRGIDGATLNKRFQCPDARHSQLRQRRDVVGVLSVWLRNTESCRRNGSG